MQIFTVGAVGIDTAGLLVILFGLKEEFRLLIVLLIFLIVSCSSMKIAAEGQFHNDYLSKSNTTAINGIFVVLVFLCHFAQYVKFSPDFIDQSFVFFKSHLGQLVVTTFLFFSGYGIICSISKKGLDYVKAIPKKRFLSVLIHFDIAVILFMVVNVLLGKGFPIKENLIALTGWESIGNSNWYIFAILALYLIVFLSFIVCKGNKYIGTAITAILTVGFVFVMILAKKPNYYYNTLICYPAGMIYGLFKDKFDKIIMHSDFVYTCFVAAAFAGFLFTYRIRDKGVEQFSLCCLFFIAVIVLVSMKIQLNNSFLQLMGNHVFAVYILQRIPMLLLSKIGLNNHAYIFLIASFIVTLGMTFVFDKCMSVIDKKLLKL